MDFLHLRSPKNWINDPNGFIYFNGEYHIYYQHYPYGPEWGTMHWGHATTKDLVHFRHHDIAIYPDTENDCDGVFSGNAVVKDGKLYIYYTGIRYEEKDPEMPHLPLDGKLLACQMLVTSEDGYSFDKADKRVVVPMSQDDSVMSIRDTRDPKVIKCGDKYVMMLGSTEKWVGKALLLESTDGENWKLKSALTGESFGSVFECPDIFRLEDKHVIFCAATDYLKDENEYKAQEIYAFADFDADLCRLTSVSEPHFLDYGMDLYATQTLLDENGDRILLAWMRMPVPFKDEKRGEYSGLFIMPRIIELKDDRLYFRPHPNVVAAFDTLSDISALENMSVQGVASLQVYTAAEGSAYRLSADLTSESLIDINGYIITYKNGRVTADRSAVYPKGNYRTVCATPPLENGHHIDVYVDKGIIEIYANNGEYVLSNIIYTD